MWHVGGILRLVAFGATTAALAVVSTLLRHYGGPHGAVHVVSVAVYLGVAHLASDLADRAAVSMPTRRGVDRATWGSFLVTLLVDLL